MPYLDCRQGPFWNLDGACLGHMAARPAGTNQSAGGERTLVSARGRPQGFDLGFGLTFSITRASRRDRASRSFVVVVSGRKGVETDPGRHHHDVPTHDAGAHILVVSLRMRAVMQADVRRSYDTPPAGERANRACGWVARGELRC
jgi:hypothetical protein